jgi:hypothetical protein
VFSPLPPSASLEPTYNLFFFFPRRAVKNDIYITHLTQAVFIRGFGGLAALQSHFFSRAAEASPPQTPPLRKVTY